MKYIQQLIASASLQVRPTFHEFIASALAFTAENSLEWISIDGNVVSTELDESQIFMRRIELPVFGLIDFESQVEIAESVAKTFEEATGLFIPIYADEDEGKLIAYFCSAPITEFEAAEYFEDEESEIEDDDGGDDPEPESAPAHDVRVPPINADGGESHEEEFPLEDEFEIEIEEPAKLETPVVIEIEEPEAQEQQELETEVEQDIALGGEEPADTEIFEAEENVEPAQSEEDSALADAIAEEQEDVQTELSEQEIAAQAAEQKAQEIQQKHEAMFEEIRALLPEESITEMQADGTMQILLTGKNDNKDHSLIVKVERGLVFGVKEVDLIILTVDDSQPVQMVNVNQLADYITYL